MFRVGKILNCCVALFCLTQILGAQNNTSKPGGIQGASLWLVPVPVSEDIQGDYYWRNYAKIRRNQNTDEDDWVKTQTELVWQVPRTHVRHSNYQPLLPISQDAIPKSISIKGTSLDQMTTFAIFTRARNDLEGKSIKYIIDGSSNTFVATHSKIIYPKDKGESNKDDLSLLKGQVLMSSPQNLLYQFTHSATSRPVTPSVWGQEKWFRVSWGAMPNYLLQNPSFTSYAYAPDLYCSEFIIFSRCLSPTERLRVESYLAIKYGAQINKSYLLGKQIVWAKDDHYHNHVSGFASINSAGLSTQRSTLRYSDTPIGTHENELPQDVDSFFEGNSYNGSSKSNLLSISREDGSPLDSCYFIYGDNNDQPSFPNASLPQNSTLEYRGVRFLKRRWRASYYFPGAGKKPDKLWNGNLHIEARVNHLYSFSSQDSVGGGIVRTTQPLSSDQGYYSFTYMGGACKIGYEVNSQLYAYSIDRQGGIRGITKGVIGVDIGHSLRLGDRVELLRESGRMYLRINGRSVTSSHIMGLPKAPSHYLGFLEVSNRLDNLRVGGFYDTGCKVELSSSLFPDISDEILQRIYLIIDPNEDGTFRHKDLIFIPATSWDKDRDKIIFNNVYWSEKDQGLLYFTFGYRDAPFILYAKDNGCLLSLKVPVSERQNVLYQYNLKNTKTGKVVDTGIMHSAQETQIAVHESSVYELSIEESQFKDPNWTRFHFSSVCPSSPGVISWSHQSGEEAIVLFRNHERVLLNAGARFRMHNPGVGARGIRILGDRLIAIYDFPIYESSYNLHDGDQITIEMKSNGYISYWINKQPIWGFEMSKPPVFGMAANFEAIFSRYFERKIKNLLIRGLEPWRTSYLEGSNNESLNEILSTNNTISIKEHIQVRCGGDLRSFTNEEHSTNTDQKDGDRFDHSSPFRVYEEGHAYRYRAVLILQEKVMVDLLVFDMAGHLIYQANMTPQGEVYSNSFEIHQPGVYIVKALTNEKEYTQKIQVR